MLVVPAVVALLLLLSGVNAQSTTSTPFVGTVSANPEHAVVGQRVNLSGSGFAPGAVLRIVWDGYKGSWLLKKDDGIYTRNDFFGRTFKPTTTQLGSVTTDSNGAFHFGFEVPEGFGGGHDVYVKDGDTAINKVGVQVTASATMEPASGPVGSDIHLTFTGLNQIHDIAGWYEVTYDNHPTGMITTITTHGTAHITIPAAGAPGRHLIILRSSIFPEEPFLNLKSSPYAFMPEPKFWFAVTDAPAVLPPPVAEQSNPPEHAGPPSGPGPKVWMDPSRATVGTRETVHGSGLPANATVKLTFRDTTGSGVTAKGFDYVSKPLLTVTTDARGAFTATAPMPDVLGGDHRLVASVDGEDVATGVFAIARSGEPITPVSGPQGTEIELAVKGIGWTEIDNIFAVVVDNAYVGYACGSYADGHLSVPLIASWAPGWHVIDLYPSFYRNKNYGEAQEAPFLYTAAIVTWQDHPKGFHFRYAFKVTP